MILTKAQIESLRTELVSAHTGHRAEMVEALCDAALGYARSESAAWTPMRDAPPINQDCRKICWIETKDGMAYIGLKAWDFQRGCWLTNGEPMLETERVTHWMPLPERP